MPRGVRDEWDCDDFVLGISDFAGPLTSWSLPYRRACDYDSSNRAHLVANRVCIYRPAAVGGLADAHSTRARTHDAFEAEELSASGNSAARDGHRARERR